MSISQLDSNGYASASQQENAFAYSPPILNSEKAVQETIQQPLMQGIEDHPIEFSEAMIMLSSGETNGEREDISAGQTVLSGKGDVNGEREDISADQPVLSGKTYKQSEVCSGKHGLCSHEDEALQDGDPNSDCNVVQNRMTRKASFKLSWSCNGDRKDQQKHDIVTVEREYITIAKPSSKQVSLKWESQPQTVLIVTKPNSAHVSALCTEMVRWLKEQKKLNIFVESRVREELEKSSVYNFVQTWQDDEDIPHLHKKVDLIVTLGGDGTVIWAASMFKGPVPLIVPFSLGSLGFMTLFDCESYRKSLDNILRGPIDIILRHWLLCRVVRAKAISEESFFVLNEVTIDRGKSSYLTNLKCYFDDSFATRVQGDGLILATTSGSTAYSLAAGGSMVHPQVPGILFTPICPHSLSFRPLILPDHVTVRIQVPFNSRSNASASFDGKNTIKLVPGDAIVCSMAPWPVPTACQSDSTSDFVRSIKDGLHWNLRKTQSFDGPADP